MSETVGYKTAFMNVLFNIEGLSSFPTQMTFPFFVSFFKSVF